MSEVNCETVDETSDVLYSVDVVSSDVDDEYWPVFNPIEVKCKDVTEVVMGADVIPDVVTSLVVIAPIS